MLGNGVGPVGILSAAQVRSVLRSASTAPSLYGSRPWRFECTPSAIEVHAELSRKLPAADPEHRQMWLACGAALLNLRLAIRALGVRVTVRPGADMGRPDLLAIVKPQEPGPVVPADLTLTKVMSHYREHPEPFGTRAVAERTRNTLRHAARAENGWFASIARDQLPTVAAFLSQAQHAQQDDPALVAERAQWGRKPREAGGLSVDRGADHETLIAVIGTFLDLPAAQLQAGQALQRILLTATSLGLSASPLSELVEVSATRRGLRALIGGGLWPQTVLRLGYGSPLRTENSRDERDLSDERRNGKPKPLQPDVASSANIGRAVAGVPDLVDQINGPSGSLRRLGHPIGLSALGFDPRRFVRIP